MVSREGGEGRYNVWSYYCNIVYDISVLLSELFVIIYNGTPNVGSSAGRIHILDEIDILYIHMMDSLQRDDILKSFPTSKMLQKPTVIFNCIKSF